MNNDEKEMFDFAYCLTRSAGLQLKQGRKNSVLRVREKTSPMDLVTEYDLVIEKYLIAMIKEKYPDHAILAEESQTGRDPKETVSCSCIVLGSDGRIKTRRQGYRWVIDPIDGTVNYYRFGKDYTVSIALYKDETPVFGLVYDVAADVMFRAGQEEGATLNGCDLPDLPERCRELNKAVVVMSLRTMREFAALGMDVLGLLSGVQAHRYLGCASLELCKVAVGDYDLFISATVYEWDVAAARIFLEQCGGFFLGPAKDNPCPTVDKLLVAAFRSPVLWRETLQYLPLDLRSRFAQIDL
jgi:myo-inositol-1(or 4)-monophosphatase